MEGGPKFAIQTLSTAVVVVVISYQHKPEDVRVIAETNLPKNKKKAHLSSAWTEKNTFWRIVKRSLAWGELVGLVR